MNYLSSGNEAIGKKINKTVKGGKVIKRDELHEIILWEIKEDALLLGRPNKPATSDALKARMLGQIQKILTVSIPESDRQKVVSALRKIRETTDSTRVKQALADKFLEQVLPPPAEKAEE